MIETNLEMFKMSKAQMNKVCGGKHFRCHVGDSVYSDYHGEPFDLDYYDFPESATAQQAQDFVMSQLGDMFFVSCQEIN